MHADLVEKAAEAIRRKTVAVIEMTVGDDSLAERFGSRSESDLRNVASSFPSAADLHIALARKGLGGSTDLGLLIVALEDFGGETSDPAFLVLLRCLELDGEVLLEWEEFYEAIDEVGLAVDWSFADRTAL